MSTTDFSQAPGTPPSGFGEGASEDAGGAKDQASRPAGHRRRPGQARRRGRAGRGQECRGGGPEPVARPARRGHHAGGRADEAQKSRLAETVRTFGDDLESMRGQGQQDGAAAQVVQQVAGQARTSRAPRRPGAQRAPRRRTPLRAAPSRDVPARCSRGRHRRRPGDPGREGGAGPAIRRWHRAHPVRHRVAAAHTSSRGSHPWSTMWRSPTPMPTWVARRPDRCRPEGRRDSDPGVTGTVGIRP